MRPKRESIRLTEQTYFVTFQTAARIPLFRHARWADLLVEVVLHYASSEYLLHAFVVMPDHFHGIFTPRESIERSVQCVKGGFSYRAPRELGWKGAIWQTGFADHRIRDARDYRQHVQYIEENPVMKGLAEASVLYAFSSAAGLIKVEVMPQRLKPPVADPANGGAEAPPLHFEEEEARAFSPPAEEMSASGKREPSQSENRDLRKTCHVETT